MLVLLDTQQTAVFSPSKYWWNSATIHTYKYVCFHLSHLSFKSLAKETYTPHCIYTSGFIRYICQTVVQMSNVNTSIQIKCMYPFPTTNLTLNFVLPYCFQYSLTASFFSLWIAIWKRNFFPFPKLIGYDFHSQVLNLSEFE